MKIGTAAMVASLALVTASCAASTDQGGGKRLALPRYEGLTCANFKQNPDGSWTPVKRVTIVGPNGEFKVEPGQKFRIQIEATTNYNVKIAETLDDICR
jgi:hypothetical protein